MKPFLFIIFLFLTTSLYSQDLKVVKPLYHKGAIATAECVTDSYGRYCAVVDIVLPRVQFEAESDMIVKKENPLGRTRLFVCVSPSSKILTIYTNDFIPFELQIGNSTLVGKELYEIVLSGETGAVPQSSKHAPAKPDVVSHNTPSKPDVPSNNSSTKSDVAPQNTTTQSEPSYPVDELYKKGDYYSNSGDINKALYYYEQSAQKGYSQAQYKVGFNYYYVKSDYATAVSWYKKAASQGNAYAQYELGRCYYYGNGVDKDVTMAKELLHKAVTQGNLQARKLMDDIDRSSVNVVKTETKPNGNSNVTSSSSPLEIYKAGLNQYYVNSNYNDAAVLFERSAAKGYAPAQYELGRCYFYGKGVEQDAAKARYWLQKAANQGNEGAKNLLKQL